PRPPCRADPLRGGQRHRRCRPFFARAGAGGAGRPTVDPRSQSRGAVLMRLLLLLSVLGSMSACERHTDRTSPCFTKGGQPAVSRASWAPMNTIAKEPPCRFVPVEQ